MQPELHSSKYLYRIVLRHYDTSRKGAGSRPDEVNYFFFNLPHPFGRTRPWGLRSI
jgi:hypothetical protein